MLSQRDTCCSLQDTQECGSPQTPAMKQTKLAESFIIVSRMRRKRHGEQLLRMQSRCISHIDMARIYSGKAGSSSTCQKLVCAPKPQWKCLKPEDADRLVWLAKNMLKRQPAHTSCPVHLPTCHVYYAMHADV